MDDITRNFLNATPEDCVDLHRERSTKASNLREEMKRLLSIAIYCVIASGAGS